MAQIKHIARLSDGTDITINFTEEEHKALLDYAVNAFLQAGWMVIGPVNNDTAIDIDAALEELKQDDQQ